MAAKLDQGSHGFDNAGEFYLAVLNHERRPDSRVLAAAAGTVSTEQSGSDGGFGVPPDFRPAITARVFGEHSLVGRTDQRQVSSNTVMFPSDMTTPWQTTGIQAYWEGEVEAIRQSKVSLENVTMRLNKLAASVPVTEELLEDAPALGAYLEHRAPEIMDFKCSHATLWGTGAGMPLGIMNSPALVTVAAEDSQPGGTIEAANVRKMAARMSASGWPNAIWAVTPDASPHVFGLGPGLYSPDGGPCGSVLGRPVLITEAAAALGDLGDIAFLDLSQFLTIKRTAGIKQQTSIHVFFDKELVAFKFTLRLAGQPWWSKPITSRFGAAPNNTRSPFVTLEPRL